MNIGDLFYRARIDGSKIGMEAQKAGTQAGTRFGRAMQGPIASQVKTGLGLGAGIAGFNIIGTAIAKVTGYLGDSAQAFREDAVSVQRLTSSLKANIEGWDGNTDAIEATIAQRQKLGFSDEDLRQSLSGLVAATHDVNRAFEIQSVAMDLARFKGISLQEATEALTKVEAGSFRILKSLGVALEEGATQEEALTAVRKLAAGQAEDYANTLDGKLLIAEEKAAEASEKFGRSIAQLQAIALPALADTIESVANQLDGIQIGFDESIPPAERLDAAVLGLNSSFVAGLPIFKDVIGAIGGIADKEKDLRELDGGVRVLAKDLSGPLPAGAKDAEEGLEDLERAAAEAEREISDLASAIADELFGDAINAGNLAQLRKTRDELLKDREELKKGSREYRINAGEIAENQQALFELQLQMKEREGPRAVIAWLKTQKELFGDASGAIQRLIDKYRTLAGVITNLPRPVVIPGGGGSNLNQSGGGKRNRAHGGPVRAGEAYIVGEHRPEVFVPDTNGQIIASLGSALSNFRPMAAPAAAGGSTGPSIGSVYVTVDARGLPNPGAVGSAVKQGVADAMADVFRGQTARLPVGTRG